MPRFRPTSLEVIPPNNKKELQRFFCEKKFNAEELLELTETVSDDELNLRELPVYRNSGAIVVESSIHDERADLAYAAVIPRPPTPCGKEKIIGDTDLTAPSLSLRCLPPQKAVSETMKSEASPEENG